MTHDLEKRAEEIAKKAVGDDYIEDGGYIRDWLYADILKALSQTRPLLSVREENSLKETT